MPTKIEWTDSTWSPVTGCTKVSEGCDHCYAETIAHRFAGTKAYPNGFDVTLRPERLEQPLRWKRPRKVFVNSMSDLFHKDVPDDYIARVWQAMTSAPQHTYQILTKRPGRMASWVRRWYAGEIDEPYEERPVRGFPGYVVTTRGEVFGKRRGTDKALRQDVGEKGHRRVTMYHDEGSGAERALVHRLVLEAFVRRAVPGEQACHRNGDPADNRLSNLYWGTQQTNWQDRISHGNARSHSKLTEDDVVLIRARYAGGDSAYRIAKDYPVSDTQIRNVVNGAQWVTPPVEEGKKVVAPARALLDFVWVGTSVENQKWADVRIPLLLDTPAAVRFLSCEPLLGEVTLTPGLLWAPSDCPEGCGCAYPGAADPADCACDGLCTMDTEWNGRKPGIDWVICGGESGPGARPMHPDWARWLRDQCVDAGIPFLFKQWGEWVTEDQSPEDIILPGLSTYLLGDDEPDFYKVGKKAAGRELDGQTWDEYPGGLTDG